MDVTNSFTGGFDSLWCNDPQYCDPASATVRLLNDRTFPAGYDAPAPPRSADHVYTYVLLEEVAGTTIQLQLGDSAYDDNEGSFTVAIYTS